MATSTHHPPGQCPDCDGRLAIDGTEHCTNCGLVVDERPIDHGPDWRSFADDESDPERAAPADKTYTGDSMGSIIGFSGDMDNRKREFHRRAKIRDKRERNEAYLTTEIRRIVSALDLPDSLQDQAAQLMTTLYSETDGLQGQDLDTIAAAGAFVVARIRQQGVTADEVVAVSRDVERKMLLRRQTWLCDTLGLSAPLPDYEQRLTVVASKLGVSDEVRDRAHRALGQLDDMDRQQAQPSTVAARLLWRLTDRPKTQQACADAAGVTPTTIRNCDRKLPEPGQTTIEQF